MGLQVPQLPALQTCLPLHRPTVQLREMPLDDPLTLSILPSQSSSWLLQDSVFGLGAEQFRHAPEIHVSVPLPQTDVQVCVSVLLRWSPGLLSTNPSQSSSFPLHVSSVGGGLSTHELYEPLVQVSRPEQRPFRQLRESGVLVFLMLSVLPSQSSSLPLHTSVLGATVQLRHAPEIQDSVPVPQPVVQAWVRVPSC